MSKELKRAYELREELRKASIMYYNTKPIMTDQEYDLLYDEYVYLEQKYPELKDATSPTNLVGATVVSSLKKVNHLSPLLSINNKSKTKDELVKWYRGLGGDGVEILIEPKYDGITIDTIFKEKSLVLGATRGDGYVGEDITHNVRVMDTPKAIDYDGLLEVRGEGIIHMEDFINEFSNEYSNPRNLVAGTLIQLDNSLCIAKKPDVIFYDIGKCDKSFIKDTEQLDFLNSLGFKTTPYILVNNEKDLVEICESRMNGLIPMENGFNVLRTNEKVTDIMCDGLVLKVNDLSLREKLGFTAKGPRWGFAWKFKSITAKTTLKEVKNNTTRTGRIAPVAVFDTVLIGGVKVSNATLNNYAFINSLPLVNEEGEILQYEYGLKIGDEILVARNNDVIPAIVGILKRNPNAIDIEEPKFCQTCGSPIFKEGAFHFCENINCMSRLKGSLELFVSRDAMNILGFGSKDIDFFVDNGYIKNITEIYQLEKYKNDIITHKGYGIRKVEKILKAIEESKNQSFEKVLCSLGIPNVGKVTSKVLTRKFKNIEMLIEATIDDLVQIEDIGEETAKNIYNYFKDENNLTMIHNLKEIGLQFEILEDNTSSNRLEGKTFVITGTLSRPRNFFNEIIEGNGGKCSSSVSKKTYAVIIGEDAGSKETKARDLVSKGANIRLIEGYDEFVILMKEFNILL